MKKTKYNIEIRPIISRTIHAESWEQAVKIIKREMRTHPLVLEDIVNAEIYNVTSLSEGINR